MAISSTAVATSTTAAVAFTPTRENQRVTIKNNDASILLYLGGSDVSSSNGFTLAAGGSHTFENLQIGDVVYVVAASGTPSARVITQGI